MLCVVPVEGVGVDEDALREHLRARLAAYKVPKRVLAFREDELAYTGNQKIQVPPLKEAAIAKLVAEKAEIDGYRFQSG